MTEEPLAARSPSSLHAWRGAGGPPPNSVIAVLVAAIHVLMSGGVFKRFSWILATSDDKREDDGRRGRGHQPQPVMAVLVIARYGH
jgi:hypothetical protein